MSEGRMLIVEDDFDISNMLRIYFQSHGYEVAVAQRGEDVLLTGVIMGGGLSYIGWEVFVVWLSQCFKEFSVASHQGLILLGPEDSSPTGLGPVQRTAGSEPGNAASCGLRFSRTIYRKLGKVLNFGLLYGARARTFQTRAQVDYGLEISLAAAADLQLPAIQRVHKRLQG